MPLVNTLPRPWYSGHTQTDITTSSDESVWIYWNAKDVTYATAQTTPLHTDSHIWSTWCGHDERFVSTMVTQDYEATTNEGATWRLWVNRDNQTVLLHSNRTLVAAPLSAEQMAALEQQRVARAVAAKQREHNRRIAAKRAEDLLMDHLTLVQREQLRKHKWFIVQGGKSSKQYRLEAKDENLVSNIKELDKNGKPITAICAHPGHQYELPFHDHLLAQKVWLEHNEDEFIRIANKRSLVA